MDCPICHHTDSRVLRTDKNLRRLRQCTRCLNRWPTCELSEQEVRQLRSTDDIVRRLTESISRQGI